MSTDTMDVEKSRAVGIGSVGSRPSGMAAGIDWMREGTAIRCLNP